jgi:hypothetical protein
VTGAPQRKSAAPRFSDVAAKGLAGLDRDLGETVSPKRSDILRQYCVWFARRAAQGLESRDLIDKVLDRVMRAGETFSAFKPAQRQRIEVELRRLLMDARPPAPKHGTGMVSHGAKRSLIVNRASNVKPEKIEWLWPGRIARGKHTTLAGDPGTGKSQVMIWIGAIQYRHKPIAAGASWRCCTAANLLAGQDEQGGF